MLIFFFFDNVLYSRIDIIKEVLCENDSFFKYMVNFDQYSYKFKKFLLF